MPKESIKIDSGDLAHALRGIFGTRRDHSRRASPATGETGRSLTESRVRRLNLAEIKLRNLLDTKDAARAERVRIRLSDIAAKRRTIMAESIPRVCLALSERSIKMTRALTLQEKRVDFQALNDRFNKLETDLEDDLIGPTSAEAERMAQTVKNKLDAGDIVGIAVLAAMLRGMAREAFNSAIKGSYEVGKATAAKELGIVRPGTPLADTQLMNLDAADLAEGYASILEQAAKGAAKNGIAVGASTEAIASSVRDAVNDAASRAIINASGTVSGQYVNRGRSSLLFDNVSRIVSFQRSEVLDDATCDMCLSLDERIVSPDDPFSRMEIVHTHCRGLWVPIFTIDEEQPDVTGVPKPIKDNFDTVDGRPIVNAFDQLKRPVNNVSSAAAELVLKRLKGNK